MTYDCSRITVPRGEDELADYDWENFPPTRLSRSKSSFAIIDEFTGIEGKLVTRNAFIHGEIQGLVFAEHVVVEKTGRVNGVIFCRTLTVFGDVKAEIVCDDIFVRSSGSLSGTLKYRSLKIEPGGAAGGQFERRCTMGARAGAQSQKNLVQRG